MSGGIIRAPRAHTHDQLPRAALRDHALSFRARGILARLLTNADGYRMTAEDLAREGKEGRGAILTALKELKAARYMRTVRRQLASGRWVTETFVYETPEPADGATEVRFSDAGFPDAGSPNVGALANKSRVKNPREKQQQERTNLAAAAPSGSKQYSSRPSGIECWGPEDVESAVAVEAAHELETIAAAVAAIARRGKSPVPGAVAAEIRRIRQRARTTTPTSITTREADASAFAQRIANLPEQEQQP